LEYYSHTTAHCTPTLMSCNSTLVIGQGLSANHSVILNIYVTRTYVIHVFALINNYIRHCQQNAHYYNIQFYS